MHCNRSEGRDGQRARSQQRQAGWESGHDRQPAGRGIDRRFVVALCVARRGRLPGEPIENRALFHRREYSAVPRHRSHRDRRGRQWRRRAFAAGVVRTRRAGNGLAARNAHAAGRIRRGAGKGALRMRKSSRTDLINEVRRKKECPQGLPPKKRRMQKPRKPDFLRLQMSELKLRPPRTIYEMASRVFFSLGMGVLSFFAVCPAFPQAGEPLHKTTYYLHGRIYTNDPKMPWASAMAVRDEKILCIGSIEHIMLDCGGSKSEAEIVQLKGRFVMPGFNDAHTHLGGAGRDKLTLDLKGTDSLAELQQRVRLAVAQHKPGEWVVGSGWDQTRWPEKTFSHRQDLDEGSPNDPVFLVDISGHVAVANSVALKRTEITPDTKNPTGGEIERDAEGNPTGMFKEGSAMEFVVQKIPEPTDEARRHGIELVLQELARNGVSSAQDNSAWEDFLVYHDLKEEKKLTVRITEWLPFMAPLTELQNMRSEGGTTDPWLKTGAVKMAADGALGSRTAALLAPYSDDANKIGRAHV